MPSRRRPRRPGRRPTAALHPTRPRPARTAPRPQRSHRPTAAKAARLPRQLRDTPEPAHVLEQCALPGCTSPPVFKNKGARYCCDLHRLQHWRKKKRAAGPPAGSPTTPTRSRLTPPAWTRSTSRNRRNRRGLTPSISRFWPRRGRSSNWRSCSSSTRATRTPGSGCGICVAARPSGVVSCARKRPAANPT